MSTSDERTVGQVVGGMPMTTAGVVLGLAVLVIGSFGPWANVLSMSVSGTDGDGKLTLALAVIAGVLVALRRRRAVLFAAIAMLGAIALTGYDLTNIESLAQSITLLGAHIASAGWGIYAALFGAIVAFVALGADYLRGRRG